MSVQKIVDEFYKFKKKPNFFLLLSVVNNRKGEFKKEINEFIRKRLYKI